MNLVDIVEKDHLSKNVENFPEFRTGDTLAVYARIKEGDKSRVQIFQGVCIAMKSKNTINGHFRVRKISSGMGVERVFPFHSPNVEKIEIIQRGKSRRSKLYYLRDRSGKSARIAIDYDRK
ncbi:50S ribosomal protein L19 [Halobacteriovorax marinus]|uniref:Large ribosomal subunit protein bL19 n=1 Tax=Halobacteriovorax marinus TaxID=97084 RepID=A0A1Y5F491_9BACT|nr:50S ribosomal protein L19 [Halobacteriovorax marinus]